MPFYTGHHRYYRSGDFEIMRILNWSLLRHALFTCRYGSASGAAQALNVTHATVIRSLRKLEEETETQLFIKSPTGYSPTENGKNLIEMAENIETQIYHWKSNVEKGSREPKGSLRITTTEAIMNHLLCPILPFFYEEFPYVDLNLSTSYNFDNITNHDFDIAIRSTSSPPDHLVGRKIMQISWGAFQKHGANPQSDTWIGFNNNQFQPSQWMKKLYPEANIVLTTSSILSHFSAAKSGIGKALLPLFLTENETSLNMLQQLPSDQSTQLWCLYHRESRNTPKVRAFANWIYSQFSQLESKSQLT